MGSMAHARDIDNNDSTIENVTGVRVIMVHGTVANLLTVMQGMICSLHPGLKLSPK